MRLSDLKIGKEGIVQSIDIINVPLKRHLLEMGLTCGCTVKVSRKSPMEDLICLQLRGYELALRNSEAKFITVEVVR